MTSMILIILVSLIIASIFGIVTVSRQKPIGDGEDMFRNLYVYLVLFATLMMTIGGSIGAFMSIADYVSPNVYVQSFEEYKVIYDNDNEQAKQQYSNEQIKVMYDDYVDNEVNREKERALNGLIKSLGWIVIPLPIFLYFQRLTRKEK